MTSCGYNWIILVLVGVISCLLGSEASSVPNCGGFIDIVGTQSGKLTSPNYPFNYPDNALCIWMMQCERNYLIHLTIESVWADGEDGVCNDYLEVRDGNSTAPLRLYTCNVTSPMVITSKASWLWVKFKSDRMNTNAGFQAEWQSEYHLYTRKQNKIASPIKGCRSFEFTCKNKECITTAYICDSMNDCGCKEGCDEWDCTGLPFTRAEMIAIGISVGITGFVIVLVVVIFMDRTQHNSVWTKLSSIGGRGNDLKNSKKLPR